MPIFEVRRHFITQHIWMVQADSKDHAEKLLNNDQLGQPDDENWLGQDPVEPDQIFEIN